MIKLRVYKRDFYSVSVSYQTSTTIWLVSYQVSFLSPADTPLI